MRMKTKDWMVQVKRRLKIKLDYPVGHDLRFVPHKVLPSQPSDEPTYVEKEQIEGRRQTIETQRYSENLALVKKKTAVQIADYQPTADEVLEGYRVT